MFLCSIAFACTMQFVVHALVRVQNNALCILAWRATYYKVVRRMKYTTDFSHRLESDNSSRVYMQEQEEIPNMHKVCISEKQYCSVQIEMLRRVT